MTTPNGIARGYYENGNLEREMPCLNFKFDGLLKYYYEDGSLAREILAKEGKALEGYLYMQGSKKIKLTKKDFKELGFEYLGE